jgi:hypothetical protein
VLDDPGTARGAEAEFTRSAIPRAKPAGFRGAPNGSSPGSNGTSQPVAPSTTTSGMPPTAEATTGASHAIASRLTSPNGS